MRRYAERPVGSGAGIGLLRMKGRMALWMPSAAMMRSACSFSPVSSVTMPCSQLQEMTLLDTWSWAGGPARDFEVAACLRHA